MTLLLEDRTSTELPLPLVRWLEVARPDDSGTVDTLTVSGPIRIRRGHLRLRGDTTMRFDLGRGYVSDIRIGIGPMTAVRGLDALVDGTGITVIGKEASTGLEIDQGTFLALWCESLLFPTAWARLPGLRWTPVDDHEVMASLPFRGGTELVTLTFDPDGSAFPVSFHAERYREVGKPKVGWTAAYGEWHWHDGIAHPTRLRVQWADDSEPWFDMRVESIVPNKPLDEHRARALAAIAGAAATR
jgi:hypothetical protein